MYRLIEEMASRKQNKQIPRDYIIISLITAEGRKDLVKRITTYMDTPQKLADSKLKN
jgi:hypothetical protein